MEKRLSSVRRRLDQICFDDAEGKVSEDFWSRKTAEWQQEGQQILLTVRGLEEAKPARPLGGVSILKPANKANSLYVRQNHAESARLLKIVLSDCLVDSPTGRKRSAVPARRVRLVRRRGSHLPGYGTRRAKHVSHQPLLVRRPPIRRPSIT